MEVRVDPFYPIFLKIAGKRAVVVGGGPVAARKAASLIRAGASVTVISPELSEQFESLIKAGAFIHEAREYRAGDLSDAFIAVAATDDSKTNATAAKEAGARGILVNCANPPEAGSFIVPSTVQRDGLTIAVSTGGACPALAKRLRRDIESFLAAEYGLFLAFLEEARAALKERLPGEDSRRQVLEGLVDSGIAETFKGDREAALRAAWERFEELIRSVC